MVAGAVPPAETYPAPWLRRFIVQRAGEMRANLTESERWVWELLRDRKLGVTFESQVPMFSYILDFYSSEWHVCVELDGRFHRGHEKSDKRRDEVLAWHGIKTVRVPSYLIFKSPQAVLRLIRFTAGVDMFPESEYPPKARNKKKPRNKPTPYEQVFGKTGAGKYAKRATEVSRI